MTQPIRLFTIVILIGLCAVFILHNKTTKSYIKVVSPVFGNLNDDKSMPVARTGFVDNEMSIVNGDDPQVSAQYTIQDLDAMDIQNTIKRDKQGSIEKDYLKYSDVKDTRIFQKENANLTGNEDIKKLTTKVANNSKINFSDFNHMEMGTIKSKYQVIIFTSFYNRSDREAIQRHVIDNWSRLGPEVHCVMFNVTYMGVLEVYARSRGWDVVSYPHVNKYGTPFLKNMFEEVFVRYDSEFYGFVNGDILFTNQFTKIIISIIEQRRTLSRNVTMVIGKRLNYYITGNESTEMWYPENVSSIPDKSVKLSRSDTEDYFFVTRDFPFDIIKNVVIGRPGYDNYLVGTAVKANVSVIDTSLVLKAYHISTKRLHHGSNNIDARYNKKLIGRFNYHIGLTSSTPYFLRKNKKGDILVLRRHKSIPLKKREMTEDIRNQLPVTNQSF